MKKLELDTFGVQGMGHIFATNRQPTYIADGIQHIFFAFSGKAKDNMGYDLYISSTEFFYGFIVYI